MTDNRGFDPLRLAEAALAAAVVVGATILPVAWRHLDSSLTAILAAMLVLLTAGVYALHAVTFDCFRMTKHRAKRSFSLTHSEE
jgi:hypothetical protein